MIKTSNTRMKKNTDFNKLTWQITHQAQWALYWHWGDVWSWVTFAGIQTQPQTQRYRHHPSLRHTFTVTSRVVSQWDLVTQQ